MFTKNVVLHNDFAQDIIDKIKDGASKSDNNINRVLININSYIYNPDSVSKIKTFVKNNSDKEKYFMSFDMFDDIEFYEQVKHFVPDLKLYDWTDKTILDIIVFMNNSGE